MSDYWFTGFGEQFPVSIEFQIKLIAAGTEVLEAMAPTSLEKRRLAHIRLLEMLQPQEQNEKIQVSRVATMLAVYCHSVDRKKEYEREH